MGLSRLMRNFMIVQTSEGAPKTSQGAIDRQGAWTTVADFKNLRCNIQEKNRRDLISTDFSIVGEEHVDLIYHQSLLLYNYSVNHAQLRFITNKDPRKQLTFPTDLELGDLDKFNIYEFKGHVEQIRFLKRTRLYIIRCERNERQVFA